MKSDPFAKTDEGSVKSLLLQDGSREDIVVRALQECQAAIDAGQSVDREAMFAKYPEIRDELSACLEGLELMNPIATDDKTLKSGGDHLPSGKQLRPSATLGDFRIESEIGRGGMGVVYQAEQLSVGRKVALKVLPYAAMLDKRQVARFQNEARAAATLEHPHIVPVYFVGNERGVYYYAMRLIGGKNLAEVLQELLGNLNDDAPLSLISSRLMDRTSGEAIDREGAGGSGGQISKAETVRDQAVDVSTGIATDHAKRGRVYFESVARLAKQTAEALEFAHSHGIIHRDIKPANIMLDEVGDAWVTDFGLARIESDAGMTMTGDLIGTLRYMAPEQTLAKRVAVDHRADVYSLGATLYELLALKPLFEGADRATLLKKIAFEEPRPLSKIVKGVPADLETIVLKTLHKNPDNRYATAQEFADDLQRFLVHQPVVARRTPLSRRLGMWTRRHPSIVAATAIVSAVALISAAAIGLLVARHERDARTQQQAATKEIAGALQAAQSNLELANEERERAESNLSLAIQAVEETYLNSIGEDRLLRIGVRTEFTPPLKPQKLLTAPPLQSSGVRFSQIAQRPTFSDAERDVVQRGLKFFDQIASLNPTSPKTQFQSAKAFTRLALLYGGLDENAEAQAAYEAAISRLKSLTEQDGATADYFVELARAYYQQGRLSNWWPDAGRSFDEAIAAATRAIQIDPDNAEAYRLRGRAHLCLHEYARASRDFDNVVNLESGNAAAHYELSQALEEANDLERAASHLRKAVDLEPANHEYRNALASLYKFGLKDKESAGALFEPLLQGELSSRDEAEIRARQAHFKGPPKDVIKYVDRFNELGGESFETYCRRARAHRWQKKVELAEADLQAATKLAITDRDFRDIAVEQEKLRNWEQSLTAWDTALELNPNNYELFKGRGFVLWHLGEQQKAMADFERFVSIVPEKEKSAVLLKSMGRLNFRLGYYRKALQCIETSMELNPKDPSVVNWINYVYQPKEFDPPGFRTDLHALMKRAIERFSKHIQQDPSVRNYWHNRATAYLELGRLDEAIADFLQAVDVEPEGAYSWTMLARAYGKKGLYEKALAAHAKAIKLDPDRALPYVARAGTHEQDGNLQQAVKDLELATNVAPDDVTAWERLGVLLTKTGQLAKSIDAYTVVIEKEPFQLVGWVNRGNVYKQVGQLQNAIDDYSRAIDLNPNHWVGWRNRGLAYMTLGQFQRAFDDANRAIDVQPDLPHGWHNRGIALFKLGRCEDATADFSKATELGDHSALRPHAYSLWKLDQADDAVPLLREYLEFEKKKQEEPGIDIGVDIAVIEALRNLAYMQLAADQKADALESFQKASQLAEELTTIAPEDTKSWGVLGRGQAEFGDFLSSAGERDGAFVAYELAHSAYKKSLEVDSHPSRLHNLAGFLVYCREKNLREPERALQLATQAAEKAGTNISNRAKVELTTIVGLAHYRLGEWQQALDTFESITEPMAVDHRYYVAMTHWKMGNQDVARKKLDDAIKAENAVRSKEAPPYDVIAGWERVRLDTQELVGIQAE